jgi:prophage DNA circulation protein
MRVADAAGVFNQKFKETPPAVAGAKKEVESFAAALKDKLSEAVDTAKDKLAEAQGEFDGFATKVSDAVKGALDFNAALEAGDYGFKGFLDALRDQVKGVVEYSVNLGKALEMGLSQDALGYVMDAGNVAGAEIANELVKGGQAAIDETNALVDAAKRAADKVGIEAANRWYKSGVDQAKFIVDGLQAELNKLTPKLMAQMDAIAAKLKRNVDIDVVITERVNKIVTTITGAAPGLPTTTLPKIVTPIVPLPAPRPIDRPGGPMGALGSSGVTVNVTGGLSTSAEIGQSVVNALRAYSRTAGPLQLNVAQ